MMGLAQKVAQYIVQADLSQFPPSVTEKSKQCILDAIGCGLFGQEFEAPKIVLAQAEQWGGKPEASVLGRPLKLPSVTAAKVNGTALHVADFDDSSAHFRGHPTAVVLPPALALCETTRKSGREVLLSYIVGLEVGGKLGKVMGWSHYEIGWHGTGTIGTVAAAAASAKALGLNEEKTAHALAIAASGACGIRENLGTMVKSLHAGQACAAGVSAALLAGRGYQASLTAFEGRSGFYKVYNGGDGIDRWVEELAGPSALDRVVFKRYPSCACTHPPLDALEDLKNEHAFSWEDVEEIICLVPPVTMSILVYTRPKTGLEAKFSNHYCLAASLVHGKLALSHFEDKALQDPRVKALIGKIKMVPDDEMGRILKENDFLSPSVLHIRLKDRTLTKRMLEARGGGSSPLSYEEIVGKFRICAGRILSAEKVEGVIGIVSSLESIRYITTLTEALSP
jgi:2-methylcitrate dehydratase PrpD